MNTETKKKLLYKHKLETSDFYIFEDKIILRRTGMDKLEKQNPAFQWSIESIQSTPHGSATCTTILGSGRIGDTNKARTVASANPDNCKFPHYAEVALKRFRHRLLLMLLDLYELDIYSEEESPDFVPPRANDFAAVVSEIEGLKNKA